LLKKSRLNVELMFGQLDGPITALPVLKALTFAPPPREIDAVDLYTFAPYCNAPINLLLGQSDVFDQPNSNIFFALA
jgi:hypothetical protein